METVKIPNSVRITKLESEMKSVTVVVKETDRKVDVVHEATKAIAMNIKAINDRSLAKPTPIDVGTIQKGDWKGTLAAVIATAITVSMTAWALWSIMFGDQNPFIAYLSIVTQPTLFLLIKTLTGQDIKKSDLMHQLDLKKKANEQKLIVSSLQGINQSKTFELNNKNIRIARLEEKLKKNGIAIDRPVIAAPTLPPG